MWPVSNLLSHWLVQNFSSVHFLVWILCCGLTRHFGENHGNNIEEAIGDLIVTLVNCGENEENLELLEDRWILKMGTLFIGLNSHNEVLSNRRRNYEKYWEGFMCNLYVTSFM